MKESTRQFQAMKDCKWEYRAIEKKEKYHWEIWTYEECGVDVRLQSRAYSEYGSAVQSLKRFFELNEITKYERWNKPVKTVPVGKKHIAIVDRKDYEKVMRYKWLLSSGGYVITQRTGRQIMMHRLITGLDTHITVDHANRNPLDNTRKNLRVATYSQNAINSKVPVNNRSGYKGVFFKKQTGRWCAQINHKKKRFNLGYFDTAEKAAKAYNQKARELFGEFAHLNKIEIDDKQREKRLNQALGIRRRPGTRKN